MNACRHRRGGAAAQLLAVRVSGRAVRRRCSPSRIWLFTVRGGSLVSAAMSMAVADEVGQHDGATLCRAEQGGRVAQHREVHGTLHWVPPPGWPQLPGVLRNPAPGSFSVPDPVHDPAAVSASN